jgi:hypothetical protein
MLLGERMKALERVKNAVKLVTMPNRKLNNAVKSRKFRL